MNRTLLLAAFLTEPFATLAQSSWGIAPTEPAIQQVNLRPNRASNPSFGFFPMPPPKALPCSILNRTFQLATVVAESQACVAQIVDWDDFCVTTEWDGICQDQYDCCASSPQGILQPHLQRPRGLQLRLHSCLSGLAGTAEIMLYDDDCSENCVTRSC